MVNLLTDRIGSQLQTSSDVKIRGLIVGEVRSIETTGNGRHASSWRSSPRWST